MLETGSGPLLGARLEVNAIRADLRPFPAELAITRVDVPGPLLFAVSLRDVTKRHQRDERMREAEAKYRTLVEQLPIATYVNDAGMPVRTRYMSPQIETMLGFPVSDWLRSDNDFYASRLHPEDRDRVLAEVARTHELGEDFRMEYRLISADGTAIWVRDQTVAVRDEEYRPLFLQGYLSDITDRRASEEALRQSEETHRLVLEASRDLIATIGADGTVTYASHGDRVDARLHVERARGQGARRDRASRGCAVGAGVLRAAGRRRRDAGLDVGTCAAQERELGDARRHGLPRRRTGRHTRAVRLRRPRGPAPGAAPRRRLDSDGLALAPGRPAALVRADATVRDLEHAVGDAIEEVAVV